MSQMTQQATSDPEFDAMVSVYSALKDLPNDAQHRVLHYVLARLGLDWTTGRDEEIGKAYAPRDLTTINGTSRSTSTDDDSSDDDVDDELAGVSSVAKKWIKRNGLTAGQLSSVFSLGLDEIDVVARSVPGDSKREKMRNILLLTGAAAYLGSGAARADDDALRQALSHYNAYDRSNFATYMREFSPDVSGTKESGYTLTARGLAAAADLVRSMTAKKER